MVHLIICTSGCVYLFLIVINIIRVAPENPLAHEEGR